MDLLSNLFLMLGARMGDNRRRIMALAEEKSLLSGEATAAAVGDAKAMLIHPRRRLTAEMGWLPGLAPDRILEVMALLKQEPGKMRSLVDLPSLARANLLAAGLVAVVDHFPFGDVVGRMIELAHVHDATAAEPTMTLFSKERSVADSPAITDLQAVDAELWGQRQQLRTSAQESTESATLWKVGKYQGKRRWFEGKTLKDAGMKIVDVQDQRFDPGMAATPLNGGDFGAEDVLVIDRMIEPIIMGPDSVVREGTVMLKKEASS